MDEDAFEELDLQHSDEESKNPPVHNKLLEAVSQLYEKKRVKAPTRKEPSLEVSEFHLSKVDKKLGRVKVTDLAKVLNKRATHAVISQKLKTAQKSVKTLPKPLEQIHANKINRVAGYENAKQQLNRWDAIVYQQRVAEQLTFPLKNETISIHENTDISKTFRKPTELEIQMAEILKSDPNLQKEEGNEKKEEDYPLTLAEVIEKRKLMARLRAQQSYKQAKSQRHSKIKSKKFHQIQRRAKVKEQLKEFEELQKKDPEAALKKLEELERTRAEERVTLRHRSTGQWAKNLAVRAKYDKEARIALSEQLSKSRELTVKLAQNKDSESEKEEEEVEIQSQPAAEDPDNPWVEQSKEMEDFVSGYRKYWESKGKEMEKNNLTDTAVKFKSSTDELESSSLSVNVEKEIKISAATHEHESNNKTSNFSFDSNKVLNNEKEKENDKISERNHVSSTTSPLLALKTAVSEFQVSDSVKKKKNHNKMNEIYKQVQSNTKINGVNEQSCNRFKIEDCKIKHNKSQTKNTCLSWTVSDVVDIKKNCKLKSKTSKKVHHKIVSLGNSFKITKIKTDHNDKLQLKSMNEINSCGINGLSSNNQEINEKKEINLDKMFEEIEDKMQNRIKEKVKKIKDSFGQKRKKENPVYFELETEDSIPSLELKKSKLSADLDEKLLESTRVEESKVKEKGYLSEITNTASDEVKIKEINDIDPNKFLKVTPRHLSSKLPEMMTEGEDVLDDEETTAGDRHLTISEAFAEDDVVDQFQKEKEEAKKIGLEDVDLTLPGWGSWGGPNIKPISRRKRKKFVIKFPKAIPRRDTNRGNVIINEDADKPVKEHQVSDVPFPFTSVKEYEASIRAPLGSTWVPQTAYKRLTLPPLVTKLGTIIPPMDDSQLVKKQTQLPTNRKKKKKNLSKVKKIIK